MSAVYYNDHDPFACAWLLELIKAGQLPEGEVDDRSILDIEPSDIRPFRQCHFFAGIGGWPHALGLAGFPFDREVWTASLPCQPLSVAGKGAGDADERHLWPAFYRLVAERRPAILAGEQVASADGREWFAGVRADLEAAGYACGATNLPACAIGAPHRRERLYWGAVADAEHRGRAPVIEVRDSGPAAHGSRPSVGFALASRSGGVADAGSDKHRRDAGALEREAREGEIDAASNGRSRWQNSGARFADGTWDSSSVDGALADAWERRGRGFSGEQQGRRGFPAHSSQAGPPGPVNGIWRDAEWRVGADGKARRVEPGLRLLAHGVPNRVGLLRGFGNAIVPQVAALFIQAVMG